MKIDFDTDNEINLDLGLLIGNLNDKGYKLPDIIEYLTETLQNLQEEMESGVWDGKERN